jgi:flagellar basal-body rod protein FlgF
MSSGIYIASAGAIAQSNAMDATANNIANATTAGFRADRVTFREALANAKSVDVALVSTNNNKVDQQAGAMQNTQNPLDLALEGDGYFAVDTKQGARYTRAGGFHLDDQRQLVTAEGHTVRGEGGPITIPEGVKQISVGTDGAILADGDEVGKLELARFSPNAMKREGSTLYSAKGAQEAGEMPKVRSGMIEQSNVNVVRGVVDLVKVSRTYESLMRVIQSYHDVESRAARELGGPK